MIKTLAAAIHVECASIVKDIAVAQTLELAALIDDLKRGSRVIINDNTTKEPEYYTAVVTRLNRKTNEVFVAFDDGVKTSYKATRSKVGLVGISKINRKRISEIPAKDINKWLEIPMGKGKRPVGDKKESGKKDKKSKTYDDAQLKKLIKGDLIPDPAKLSKGARIVVRRGKKLMVATVKTYSKATKMLSIELDKGGKTDMISVNSIVGCISPDKKEVVREKAIKPQNLGKWIKVVNLINPIPEPKVEDNDKGGFSVGDEPSGKSADPKSPTKRGGVYGKISLDRGRAKIDFMGDDVKMELKGSPSIKVDVKEALNELKNAKQFSVHEALRVGEATYSLKTEEDRKLFIKAVEKAKPAASTPQTKRAQNVLTDNADEAEKIFNTWSKKIKGGSKSPLGLMINGSGDGLDEISKYFPQLISMKFKELGKYFDESGDVYFIFNNTKDEDVYAVFVSRGRNWALNIVGKEVFEKRYAYMVGDSDEFSARDYGVTKEKETSKKKLEKQLRRFDVDDFQNSASRGQDPVSGLPTSIKFEKVGGEEGSKYPALKFRFVDTNQRIAQNWVRSWVQSRGMTANEYRVEEDKGEGGENVVFIFAVWKKV
ncbi:hypothetical protein GR11A_00019 [Vibrio phage vB_VcorM_GR11A]|nr:hypothetical protein GR11A_00019 [Vibrio phage vB_VcorM_GR11A]